MLQARSYLDFQDHSFFISLSTSFISVLSTCMCIHCVFTWFTPDNKDQKRESKPGTGVTDTSNSHVHVENWTQVSWRTVRVLPSAEPSLLLQYVFFLKSLTLPHTWNNIVVSVLLYAVHYSTCDVYMLWGQSSGCEHFLLKDLKDFIKS